MDCGRFSPQARSKPSLIPIPESAILPLPGGSILRWHLDGVIRLGIADRNLTSLLFDLARSV